MVLAAADVRVEEDSVGPIKMNQYTSYTHTHTHTHTHTTHTNTCWPLQEESGHIHQAATLAPVRRSHSALSASRTALYYYPLPAPLGHLQLLHMSHYMNLARHLRFYFFSFRSYSCLRCRCRRRSQRNPGVESREKARFQFAPTAKPCSRAKRRVFAPLGSSLRQYICVCIHVCV